MRRAPALRLRRLGLSLMAATCAGDATKAIVVLGQSLNPDASVPPLLQARIDAAARLHAEYPEAPIIVSGGDPADSGTTEAWIMAKLLVQTRGVPPASLVIESRAQNTVQNAMLSLPLVPREARHILLVTSDFHCPRASYIFEAAARAAGREQLTVTPHPVHTCDRDDASPATVRAALGSAAGGAVSSVNALDRTQRLELEQTMLRHEFLASHLPSHGDADGLGLGPLPPLPAERLRAAEAEVHKMLWGEPGAGGPEGGSWSSDREGGGTG